MTNKISIQDAILVLKAELGKDKTEGSYYHAWQIGIAMSFYNQYIENKNRIHSDKDIHHLANDAAKNFLNLICNLPEEGEEDGKINRTI